MSNFVGNERHEPFDKYTSLSAFLTFKATTLVFLPFKYPLKFGLIKMPIATITN